MPLLVYPVLPDGYPLDEVVQVGEDKYYTSSPWELDAEKVAAAVQEAESWLAQTLGVGIPWETVRRVDSPRTLDEWRSTKIGLLREVVEDLGLPWTDRHIYIALVRGMGGYAGGVKWEHGEAGFAMVGDICLEAICECSHPTAGTVLLEGWPENAYAVNGQTASLIHETLHGLDLPHPDGWPEDDRPGWEETIMGRWWKMPNFQNTRGLTQREIDRVLSWLG